MAQHESGAGEAKGEAARERLKERLVARIISGTDAVVLERAVNAALAAIPLAAQPQVQLIAPLGDRVRLYALITYVAAEGEASGPKRAEGARRLNVNYDTLK